MTWKERWKPDEAKKTDAAKSKTKPGDETTTPGRRARPRWIPRTGGWLTGGRRGVLLP